MTIYLVSYAAVGLICAITSFAKDERKPALLRSPVWVNAVASIILGALWPIAILFRLAGLIVG
jgi:hypothetical protein